MATVRPRGRDGRGPVTGRCQEAEGDVSGIRGHRAVAVAGLAGVAGWARTVMPARCRLGRRVVWTVLAYLACMATLWVPAVAQAPVASAASNGAWSIYPYRAPDAAGAGRTLFDLSVRPGQSVEDAFTLSNATAHQVRLLVYPADAYDVSSGGGFALRGEGQRNVGVGQWIHLPASVSHGYVLAAGSAVTVPFTIVVPADATPGDHAGGIVALDVAGEPSPGSHVQFQVHRGVGVRVYLHVLGPVRPALAVTDVDAGPSVPPFAFVTGSSSASIRFDVVNTGNTLFPKVRVTAYATDAFGRTVETFRPTVLTTVLPGSRETVTEPTWRGLPFAGPVTVHVAVAAAGVERTATAGFWVVPWLLIVLVVAVVVAAVLWAVRRRRRRKAGGARAAGQRPGPGGGTTGAGGGASEARREGEAQVLEAQEEAAEDQRDAHGRDRPAEPAR